MSEPDPENTPRITVNSRLARWLLLLYHQRQKKAGKMVWPTPQIFSLSDWLNRLWVQSWPARHVITPLQSKYLWERIVRESPGFPDWDLLHARGTAEAAAQAYSLTREYRLSLETESLVPEECLHFIDWSRKYKSTLERWGALDPSELPDAVRDALREGKIPLPCNLVFSGFEEITPQFQSLLDLFSDRGVPFQFDIHRPHTELPPLQTSLNDKPAALYRFENEKEESVACARWVRERAREGKTIGIVVPEMERYRALLHRELLAELAPGAVLPGRDREPPFNISLGTPLASEPMIKTALSLLTPGGPTIPLPLFLEILKSPFLPTGRDSLAETEHLEGDLIRNNPAAIHLDLFSPRDEERYPAAGVLVRAWRQFLETREKKSPGEWARQFTQLLDRLGWPTAKEEFTLNSREYQAYEAWKKCLDDLASLTSVTREMFRKTSADALAHITDEKTFQVKTREQPIQVVGLLESAGMAFDHLWVLSCQADCLPPLPNPNPFLPRPLQKKARIPHSSAQRELEFSEKRIHALVQSCTEIAFSYPASIDGMERNLSPLLRSLDLPESLFPQVPSHRIKDRMADSCPLESWTDPITLSPTEDERRYFQSEQFRGGSGLLQSQSLCPFQAFASHRLNAADHSMEDIDFGARERGILVHRALELFWDRIRSHENLLALKSDARLDATLRDVIRQALARYPSLLQKQPRFIALEEDRLATLLRNWLERESIRSPFKVKEKELHLRWIIGGLNLSLRIDRIDGVERDNLILIDYKTGASQSRSSSTWFEERPREPQLPLYACALTPTPSAIAFAQVKKDKPQWIAVADPSLPLAEMNPRSFEKDTDCATWGELVEYWRTRLEALAGQFREGHLSIDPVDQDQTCRNCGFNTLCRIHELSDQWNPVEDDL